jgi:transposase-like protein
MNCKHCNSDKTVKDGKNPSGSEKYYCKACQRNFTPQPNLNGYSHEKKQETVKTYIDGTNYRRTGRLMKVSHQSVVNWVTEAAQDVKPEDAPSPVLGEEDVVELDELFTFVRDKKTRSTSSHKFTGKHAVL